MGVRGTEAPTRVPVMTSACEKVSFFAVGPQRTATSWLHRALKAHPQIALPREVKETFFFDEFHNRGEEWYSDLFPPAAPTRMRGEVAPTYFSDERAIARIKQYNPDARILVNIRDPIARTYSHVLHEFAKGRLGDEPRYALEKYPDIAQSGRYSHFVPLWLEAFSEHRVLFVTQAQIANEPQAVLDTVVGFLGVERVSLDSALTGRFGSRIVPRFPGLAAVAAKAARGLRSRNLHFAVEVGKKLGLRKLYTGGEHRQHAPDMAVFEALLKIHREDIDFLESRFGVDVQRWKEFDAFRSEFLER